MAKRLTAKQAAFVAAYTGEARGVGAEAARIAGYSGGARGLAARAQECLAHPVVAEAIAAHAREVACEAIASVSEAQRLLTAIARDTSEPSALRIKAAVELCRMMGAYVQRVEVTGAGGGPIETRAKLDLGELSDSTLEELEAALAKRAA